MEKMLWESYLFIQSSAKPKLLATYIRNVFFMSVLKTFEIISNQ
jgi:hypothetical protein